MTEPIVSWLSVGPPESIRCGDFVLRKYVLSDAATLRNVIRENIDHLRPWMPWIENEPQTLEDKEDLISGWDEEWQNRTGFTMGIFLGGDLVGGTGFHVRGPVGVLEIGYWIGVRYLRQGVATQVARSLTDTAFTISDVVSVEIVHDEANVPSGRVPNRLGYTQMRSEHRPPSAPGESGVAVVWSTTAEQWNKLKY